MAAAAPALITIPDVELLEVGEDWALGTGPATFTAADLAAAVSAQDDPFIRTPKIKIGHTDPRFDGEPCFGKITNMRTKNEGQTLVGDFEGVPAWFAEIMPSAYPQRSIEGAWSKRSKSGATHQFVITAVALLGDTDPGIETLEDLQALWASGPAISEVEVEVNASGVDFVAVREGEVDVGKVRAALRKVADKVRVAASVEVEDVRREYYDSLTGDQSWWWIRSVQLDPAQLIVDDDDGNIYRVSYTIGSDSVSFGDPVEVEIEYKDKVGTAASRGSAAVTWASKKDSRDGFVAESESEEDRMTKEQLAKLGLPEDATQEQIDAALQRASTLLAEHPEEEVSTEGETPETETETETEKEVTVTETEKEKEKETPVVPEGMVLMDTEEAQSLKTAASQGQKAFIRMEGQDRKDYLEKAVASGKFPPSRKDHYDALLQKDPKGTRTFIDALASGMIPVEAKGVGVDPETPEGDAYPSNWLPEVAARKAEVRS